MNKKHLSIISLLFVVFILVARCSPAGEVSPTSRLVGHWEAPYAGEDLPREIFLGELSNDGKGKLYLTNDFANYCERTYEVVSEDEGTYTVRFNKGYTSQFQDYSFDFVDDSLNMSSDGELLGEFKYVDSETEPEALSTLAENEAEYLVTTPLTGHWGHIPEPDGSIDENWHIYFGKINNDGEGIHYISFEPNASKYTFKIVREDGGDYDLRVQHECGGPEDFGHLEVSEDGKNLNWVMIDEIFRFEYIDSNTEP